MLTASEQILAASDRANAPLTCGVFVQTEGRLEPARLRAAVRTVIGRHPMTRAVLYGSRQHAWRFVAEPLADPVGVVDDGSDGWRIHEIMSSASFDLRMFSPIRVALVRQPDGDQLSVVAHHLAVDGLRLAGIVAEILAVYRQGAAPGSAGRETGDRRGPSRPAGPPVPSGPSSASNSSGPSSPSSHGLQARYLTRPGVARVGVAASAVQGHALTGPAIAGHGPVGRGVVGRGAVGRGAAAGRGRGDAPRGAAGQVGGTRPEPPAPTRGQSDEHSGIPAGVAPIARAGTPGWTALARGSGRYITPLTSASSTGYGFHPLTLAVPVVCPTLPDGRRMTVNDLLVAAAHLAIDRWNTRRGGESGRLRIRMPIDLGRSAPLVPSPASSASPSDPPGAETTANRTGQTIVVSEREDRADPLRLAARIVDQTRQAKQTVAPSVPGVSGAVGIAAARFIPGPWRSTSLRWGVAAARPVLAPTAAVSNLGRFEDLAAGFDLPAAGFDPPPVSTGEPALADRPLDLVGAARPHRADRPTGPDTPAGPPDPDDPPISSVYFTGTAGMPQGLFIGVVGMGNSLHLTFGYHRQLLGPGSVPGFADLFAAAFAELAGDQRPRTDHAPKVRRRPSVGGASLAPPLKVRPDSRPERRAPTIAGTTAEP